VYRHFSEWNPETGGGCKNLDYSEESLIECYEWESCGKQPSNERNGYIVGKKSIGITVTMWKEDIQKGLLLKSELYNDENLKEFKWWLDKVLK